MSPSGDGSCSPKSFDGTAMTTRPDFSYRVQSSCRPAYCLVKPQSRRRINDQQGLTAPIGKFHHGAVYADEFEIVSCAGYAFLGRYALRRSPQREEIDARIPKLSQLPPRVIQTRTDVSTEISLYYRGTRRLQDWTADALLRQEQRRNPTPRNLPPSTIRA